MRISPKLNSLSVFVTVAALAAALIAGPAVAQNTSSSIRVEVTGQGGNAVGDLQIRLTHMPTGRSTTTTSNSQGIATMRGLAVGGPYEVSVAGGDYAADVIQNIILELDQTEVIDLVVRPVIEEVIVTASAPAGEVAIGVGRAFDRATIDGTPALSRDFVQTLATDPKIMVDNSVARGPAVSLAGSNFRFNSVTIDGIAQNDNFGLSKNASATQRTPISIDAIEAVNVNIAPFDVSYGNFIGGNINIVTKSGTNEFEGSVYAFSTSDSLAGDKSDGENLGIGDFSEDYYGFTLGGPIVRDKLFFFVNYEKFDTTRPSNTKTLNNIAGVTQADVDEVTRILNEVYLFDPGEFDETDDDEDEKILVKLDWHINDDHRASLTYQEAEGDVIFDDFPELAALQSNRYNINEAMDAYSLQFFSNWTDTFSTELKIGGKEVTNRQISAKDAGTSADFLINTPGGGQIAAGNDRFRHLNELDNESDIFKLRADWQVGDHLLTAGIEREEYTVRNLFTPGSRGWFRFTNFADLENQVIGEGDVLYGNANIPSGDPLFSEANFSLAVDSFYIQDEWTPTDALTLKFGVRFDTYSNDDEIPNNPVITQRYGFPNTENLDGKDLTLPRFGFDYVVNDRLTFRGGVGLFGGGAPLIMLSNSYAGNAITRTFLARFFVDPDTPPSPTDAAIQQTLLDLPTNPETAAFDNLQDFIGAGVASDQNIDFLDPDFDILSMWKYSIGAEFVLGDEWILSADILFSEVNDGYDISELRRSQIDTAPDGRPIYTTDFDGGDYMVTNTGEGSGTVVTLGLEKSFDTNAGTFTLNGGYTFQDIEETRSYNRFVSFESYAFDAQSDLENPTLAPSRFEVEHRVTANMIWQNQWFGDNSTTIGLTYAGRSGRHFSYVFGSFFEPTFGGSALAEFFSEGDNPGAHLFYVPTSATDPLYTGDQAFLDDLDAFISSDSCLDKQRGTILGRNSCETDWVNIFSLRLAQEIKVGNSAFDIFLDIANIGNLLNSDWGRIDSYTAPSNVAPVNLTGIVGGQYDVIPSASYLGTPDTVVSKPSIARIASVYRLQFGLKFRF